MLINTKRNSFLYSIEKKRVELLHPILYRIIYLAQNQKDKGLEVNRIRAEFRDIEDVSSSDIDYYYRKYLLLKKNGYIEKDEIDNDIGERLEAKKIEGNLSNNKHIIFETTESCNLKCKYCSYGGLYSGYEKRHSQNLNTPKAKVLIEHMVKVWNSDLNISHNSEIMISFYGGEPLLNFTFIKEIVEYTRKIKLTHNYFSYGMTTNGVILDRHMDFLAENEFRILISLDGDKRSNGHRVFHDGKPSYRHVIDNINLLREKYPRYFEKCVNFASVLHNLNSFEGVYNFFNRNFNKKPQVSEVAATGIRKSKIEEFKRVYRKTSESLERAKNKLKIEKDMIMKTPRSRKLANCIHSFSGCVFNDYNELIFPRNKRWLPTGSCLPLTNRLFVSVKGEILPCERVRHCHVMGYINSKGIHIDFEGIVKKYNNLFDSLEPQCKKCYNVNHCPLCILQMENSDGDYKCPYFQDKESFKKSLSETMTYFEENPDLYKKVMEDVVFE